MNKGIKGFIKGTWFWMLSATAVSLNTFGIGIDIPIEYSLILIILSMIGFEISSFRHDVVEKEGEQ